ncbi:interferon-induced very large GTPase 1-like [Nematolebias whitei]|uniref:interferon-induced very large GTPase 1-like n=1 Tax=Nematolebias whitei TaxID=451745 RepID=UPI0018976B79|nr:interferon-induced very large GTPase 1-like [Nematolebias whitei]
MTCLHTIARNDSVEADENDLEALLSSSVNTNQTKQTPIHPMDVQMAVFHCSDSFLRQIMITKLSQCQYALPLLIPDPFTMEIECPLWTFRQITKTWKITENKGDSYITMKSIPIYKAETPLVSFFRLGSTSVSKSQLMNSLINDRHDTFFHRNCAGSTKSCHLLNGVAEIAWYFPAGKPNDAFNDCIAFCNLHGDAAVIKIQREILTEKSSFSVVLVSNLQKDDQNWSIISALFMSKKPLICLVVDDTCGTTEIKKGKYKMGLKDRSHSDVSEQLKRIIQDILSSQDLSIPKTFFQLETMAEVSGIKVDESDPICQKGRSEAMKIANLLQHRNVSRIKDDFLPCQGHLWHEWCKRNKELYNLKGDVEMDKSIKERKLMEIRKRQCGAPCSKLMKLFTKSLLLLPSKDKKYYLRWTQILTDNNHDSAKLIESKKNELENLSKELQSATFGLEHFFREMGQLYEAHETIFAENRKGEWSKYPELAADLLISGYPLELMDGDAGHVPLKWISSLLEKVIQKLGDQKVFVLSVLGVQSSGKSTMLNAMFGLQFAVSAGRCTRGAFMQLVKLSDELKKNFMFDYIVVVDTEGLRALELTGTSTLHHDNELATFVVGVGNMTLINIFGENPAEMQDILQIVVQAFMRMKKVKLSPSCLFVHQNVTDIAAAEKNMDGKRRLQEKLDQMAQLAAKEEDCVAKCFSDIIKFDVQHDVKYLAQLWEGSPPMAPPNPGYSESIQELKNIILLKASKSKFITLSQFSRKIQDLWNALLKENFVFNFKNTAEIALYRKLEDQYGNWTWTIRSNMLTIEDQLHNKIENGQLNKIDLIDLINESNKTYKEVKTAMSNFFEDDKDKEILVQWRGRFENKIKEFQNDQVRVVKRKLDEVIQQKLTQKKLDDQKPVFENKLLQKSKELAQQLKDKPNDEKEFLNQFNSVWSTWVTELTNDTKSVDDISLNEDLLTILQELGMESALIVECKTRGRYKCLPGIGDYTKYVSFPKNQDMSETNEPSKNNENKQEDTKKQKSFFKSLYGVIFGKNVSTPTEQQNSCSHLQYEDQEQQKVDFWSPRTNSEGTLMHSAI